MLLLPSVAFAALAARPMVTARTNIRMAERPNYDAYGTWRRSVRGQIDEPDEPLVPQTVDLRRPLTGAAARNRQGVANNP